MKKQAVLKWLEKNFQNLQNNYGLEDWTIDVKLENLTTNEGAGTTMAEVCSTLYEYRKASIIIYTDTIRNVQELKSVLKHEFYHIILSTFTIFYQSLLDSHTLKEDDMRLQYLLKMEELVVVHLEKKDRHS